MAQSNPREVTDRYLALTVSELNKLNLLTGNNQFQWKWLKNRIPLAIISVVVTDSFLTITGTTVRHEKVLLTHTFCNYGGYRPWFLCPNPLCHRRIGKLYLVKGAFRCRHCHNLTYLSCQNSRNTNMQSLLQGKRIKHKLFLKKVVNARGSLVSRPKGMHLTTYIRLRKKFIQSEHSLMRAYSHQIHSLSKNLT